MVVRQNISFGDATETNRDRPPLLHPYSWAINADGEITSPWNGPEWKIGFFNCWRVEGGKVVADNGNECESRDVPLAVSDGFMAAGLIPQDEARLLVYRAEIAEQECKVLRDRLSREEKAYLELCEEVGELQDELDELKAWVSKKLGLDD